MGSNLGSRLRIFEIGLYQFDALLLKDRAAGGAPCLLITFRFQQNNACCRVFDHVQFSVVSILSVKHQYTVTRIGKNGLLSWGLDII